MNVTLLGSGEMTGVPPMFTDLESIGAERRRRRPGLLVETAAATVMLDVSPDVREQVLEAQIDTLDAAFVTHFHHDHAGGIDDLGLLVPHVGTDVRMTETAISHLRNEREYLVDDIDVETIQHGDQVTVGDLTVVPFPVAHGRPEFDTVGFAVYHEGTKVVYAPDVERFCPDRPAGAEYRDADLLFVEGSPILQEDLYDEIDFVEIVGEAAADRTVLVHVNEFFDGPTETMVETAEEHGFELGQDFETYLG
ncbi:MBL fold metallo-hydrolase [Natronoarchaeum mannanilyticum]|uniref:MBL fold metallo-hydrolase n=1 Tax=Natronoarchaeum mannanilyticum TaxID=926360 RepID=A0AAV3T7Q5_9EURY